MPGCISKWEEVSFVDRGRASRAVSPAGCEEARAYGGAVVHAGGHQAGTRAVRRAGYASRWFEFVVLTAFMLCTCTTMSVFVAFSNEFWNMKLLAGTPLNLETFSTGSPGKARIYILSHPKLVQVRGKPSFFHGIVIAATFTICGLLGSFTPMAT